jgi:NAD(P)-dependent dehydrogenase (short-subunit alcohol dehydrogenase family)
LKVALITGGNKGIGYDLCRNLVQVGHFVLLAARNETLGLGAIARLKQEGAEAVKFLEIDTTKQETFTAAAKQIADTFGQLDVLINNAGINVEGDGPPSGADLSAIHKVLDTNFIGTLRVTQAMLPLLKKAPSARIVNVSSELGSMTLNSDPAWEHYNVKLIGYNASKAAMNILTVQLAWELRGTNVKVNSTNPGFTKTDLNNNQGTQPVEVGALAATRLALLDESGPTGSAVSKDGMDPW